METLTALAGSAAAAASIAPLLAASSAKAEMIADTDNRIIGEDISYPGADGDMKGYLVRPADMTGKLPAVIVIHENRGLNPHIRDVARRMALEGFVALAPDFLSPSGGTPADEDKAREMIGALDAGRNRSRMLWQPSHSSKSTRSRPARSAPSAFAGAADWSIGLRVNAPDLKAGVAYYGAQPKAENVPKIKAALLLHYAGLDERINAGIDAYQARR